MKRIVFWGAGIQLKKFLFFISNHKDITEDLFLYVIDSDRTKWGQEIYGMQICKPSQLSILDFDMVVVTPRESETIIKELHNMHIFNYELLDKYRSDIVISYQYYNNKAGINIINKKIQKNKVVIYTAISKGYDVLMDPICILPNVDYICFTDDDVTSEVWKIVKVQFGGDSQRAIREYKILPHKYLHDYDLSVWVDGNIEISGNINDYINKYFISDTILFFPHPERLNIYEEAEECIEIKKDRKETIEKQVQAYKKEKLPLDTGLFCGGVMVRNHLNPTVIYFMELWWEQINLFSFRDQISLPYIRWKTNLRIDLALENINDNKWFKVLNHYGK